MRFVLFNLVVAGALVYLLGGGDGAFSPWLERVGNAVTGEADAGFGSREETVALDQAALRIEEPKAPTFPPTTIQPKPIAAAPEPVSYPEPVQEPERIAATPKTPPVPPLAPPAETPEVETVADASPPVPEKPIAEKLVSETPTASEQPPSAAAQAKLAAALPADSEAVPAPHPAPTKSPRVLPPLEDPMEVKSVAAKAPPPEGGVSKGNDAAIKGFDAAKLPGVPKDVASRRAEVLEGLSEPGLEAAPSAAPEGGLAELSRSSTGRIKLKDGTELMSPAERQRALQNLSDELEILFLERTSGG